jgi:hypothetical protein
MSDTPTPKQLAGYARITAAMRQLLEELPAELASPPDVHFKHFGVQPFMPAYITKDDFLQVKVYTAATTSGLTLNARMITPHGRVNYTTESLDGASINTLTTSIFGLTEGFLLSLSVSNLGGGLSDQACYVSVGLQYGNASSQAPHTVLAQGFVSNLFTVDWPPLTIRGANGSGMSQFVTPLSIGVSNPSAGADWSYTIPSGTTYQLVAAQATFTPSSTAGNRFPGLILDDGSHAFCTTGALVADTASTAVVRSWFAGANDLTSLASPECTPIPPELLLGPGYRVRSNTSGILSGDQWSAIRLLFLS